MPTVMPAIKLNANDTRRDSGGIALRWLHISDTNDTQIRTKHAYAKAMGCTPAKFPGHLLYRLLGRRTETLPLSLCGP